MICLEVCTSRLLETEDSIRCELSRKILDLAKVADCWVAKGNLIPVDSTRGVSVIAFDERGRSGCMSTCRLPTEANQAKLSRDMQEAETRGIGVA